MITARFGHTYLIRALVCILVGVLAITPTGRHALADGGKVQVDKQTAGPYKITVFTSPSPIQVGTVDVSMLVQSRSQSSNLVQDARIEVAARPIGHSGQPGTYEASHDLATNKLFYASNVKLDSPGRWHIEVVVTGEAGTGKVEFEIEASEPSVTSNPTVLIPLVAAPIIVIAILIGRYRRGPDRAKKAK